MKFALFFLITAVAVFGFRQLLTRHERRQALKGVAAWVIPGTVAAIATAALVLFSLNFNGKVI